MLSTNSEVRTLPYLPPEVFDAIFKQSSRTTLKRASLVCKNWSSLTNRPLFSAVVITSVEAMKGLERSTRFRKGAVRSLRVDVPAGRVSRYTDGLVILIKELSKLEKLSLNLSKSSPFALATSKLLSAELALPKLTHLELLSDPFDKASSEILNFLRGMPNLHSLTVRNTDLRWVRPDIQLQRGLQPVKLPRLTHLGLGGANAIKYLFRGHLIDYATSKQITSLTLWPNRDSQGSQLLPPRRLRQQIRSLEMVKMKQSWHSVLGEFENMKELTLTDCDLEGRSLPRSISNVILKGGTKEGSTSHIEFERRNWNSLNPKFVREIELVDYGSEDECGPAQFQWLTTRLRINVLADGVTYRPLANAL